MRSRLFESRGLRVEAQRGHDGWGFYAYRPSISCFFREPKDLIRWCGYSKGLPTRVALEEWLDGLDQGKPARVEQDNALLKATGFGPEQHDDDGPTKMIT
jgi:hypothetical protein